MYRSLMPRTLISRKFQWLFLTVLLLVLYRNVLLKWGMDLWHDDNYSHGLLIPFVSLYFIRIRWTLLNKARSTPNNAAILIVIAGLFLFLLGYIGGELFSKRISLIIVIYGMVSFLEGRDIARILRFPFSFSFLPFLCHISFIMPSLSLSNSLPPGWLFNYWVSAEWRFFRKAILSISPTLPWKWWTPAAV